MSNDFKMVTIIGCILFFQIVLLNGHESLLVPRHLPFIVMPSAVPSAPAPMDKISVNVKQDWQGETHLDVSRLNAHRKQSIGTIKLRLLNGNALQDSTLNHHSTNVRDQSKPKKRTSTKIIRKTNIKSLSTDGIYERRPTYQYHSDKTRQLVNNKIRNTFIPKTTRIPNRGATYQTFNNGNIKGLQQTNGFINGDRVYSEQNQRTANYNRKSNQRIFNRRQQNNQNSFRQNETNYNTQKTGPSSRQPIRYPNTISLFSVRNRSRNISHNTNKRQWIRITIHNLHLLRRQNIEVFKSGDAIYVRDGNAINSSKRTLKQGKKNNQLPSNERVNNLMNNQASNTFSNQVKPSHRGFFQRNSKTQVNKIYTPLTNTNRSKHSIIDMNYDQEKLPRRNEYLQNTAANTIVNSDVNYDSTLHILDQETKRKHKVAGTLARNEHTSASSNYENRSAPQSKLGMVKTHEISKGYHADHSSTSGVMKLVKPPASINNKIAVKQLDNSGNPNHLETDPSINNDHKAYRYINVNPAININLYPDNSSTVKTTKYASNPGDSGVNIQVQDIDPASSDNSKSNIHVNPAKNIEFNFQAMGQAGRTNIHENVVNPARNKDVIPGINIQAHNSKRNLYQLVKSKNSSNAYNDQSVYAIKPSAVTNTNNVALVKGNNFVFDLSTNTHSSNYIHNHSLRPNANNYDVDHNAVNRGANSNSDIPLGTNTNTDNYSAIHSSKNSNYVDSSTNTISQVVDPKTKASNYVQNEATNTNANYFLVNSVHNDINTRNYINTIRPRTNSSTNNYAIYPVINANTNNYATDALENQTGATNLLTNTNPAGEVDTVVTTIKHKTGQPVPYVDRESGAVMNTNNHGLHANVEIKQTTDSTFNYSVNPSMNAKINADTGSSVNRHVSFAGDPIKHPETIQALNFGNHTVNQLEMISDHINISNDGFRSYKNEVHSTIKGNNFEGSAANSTKTLYPSENTKSRNSTLDININPMNIVSNIIKEVEPVVNRNQAGNENNKYTFDPFTMDGGSINNNSSGIADVNGTIQPVTQTSFNSASNTGSMNPITVNNLNGNVNAATKILTEFKNSSSNKQQREQQTSNGTDLKEEKRFHTDQASTDTVIGINGSEKNNYATSEDMHSRNGAINNEPLNITTPVQYILDTTNITVTSPNKALNLKNAAVYPGQSVPSLHFENNLSGNSKIIQTQLPDIFSVRQGQLLHETSSSYIKNQNINENIGSFTALHPKQKGVLSSRDNANIQTSSHNNVKVRLENGKLMVSNAEQSLPSEANTNPQNSTVMKDSQLLNILLRGNLSNNLQSASVNNQSSISSSLISNGNSALFNQSHQIDEILKTIRQVPILHSYSYPNGTILTWITIEAETVVNTTRKEQTSQTNNALYQETALQPFTLAAQAKQISQLSAQTESQRRFNETGVPTEVGVENPSLELPKIGQSFGALVATDLPMSRQSIQHDHSIQDQAVSNTTQAGVVEEPGSVISHYNTKKIASSGQNIIFQENAHTNGMQENGNLDTVNFNHQTHKSSISLFNNSPLLTPEQSTGKQNYSNENADISNDNQKYVHRFPEDNGKNSAILQPPTKREPSSTEKLENNLTLINVLKTTNETDLKRKYIEQGKSKSQTTTQQAPVTAKTTSQFKPVSKKDVAQRHTAVDVTFNEDPVNIHLGKASEPMTESTQFPSHATDEIITLLNRYGIKTRQDLDTLLQNRNTEENSRRTFDSITSHFIGPDTKCPIDKPCLWCKASPSWSFVDGMTGWCMRNCKSSRCKHSRCKCSCVTDNELSKHLSKIAQSDLRG